MTANACALLHYAMIISVQKLIQSIKSNTAGFLGIQSHNGKILNTKRPTEINWDWSKKIYRSLLVSEDVKCHCSLLADFKKGDKNVKTFSKGEQIVLLLRNFYRKIGRKLMISYSNKIQPLLNASKA